MTKDNVALQRVREAAENAKRELSISLRVRHEEIRVVLKMDIFNLTLFESYILIYLIYLHHY